MADQLIVTDAGRQRILQAIAEDRKLAIETVVFSSEFAEINEKRTKLTKAEDSFAIVTVEETAAERLYIEALPIPERTYAVHEAGVFLADGTLLCIVGAAEPILFAIREQKLPLSFEVTIAGLKSGVVEVKSPETRLNLSVSRELADIVKVFTDARLQSIEVERELRQMILDLGKRIAAIEAKMGGS